MNLKMRVGQDARRL